MRDRERHHGRGARALSAIQLKPGVDVGGTEKGVRMRFVAWPKTVISGVNVHDMTGMSV